MAALDYSLDGNTLALVMGDSLNPIAAAGYDPDEVRGNPELAAQLTGQPAPQAIGTGRYSPGGNELPAGLHSRSNPSDLPDAQYQASTTPQVPSLGAAAAGVAPSTPRTWQDWTQQGANVLNTNATDATNSAEQLAQRPTLLQTNAPLQTRFDAASQPLNPRAAQYKVGVGSKILRGLEGVGMGLARGGVPGAVAGGVDPRTTMGEGSGYSDPNAAYYQDTANRARTAATLQKMMAQNATSYSADTARADKLREAQSTAGTLGHDLAGAGTAAQNAQTEAAKIPIEQQNSDSRTAEVSYQSPESKANAADMLDKQTYNQRMLRLQSGPLSKLTGVNRSIYLATGSVPQPHPGTPPSVEQVAFNAAVNAWHNDPANAGKKPRVDDIRAMMQAARGLESKEAVDSPEAGAIVADSVQRKQLFADQYTRNPDGSYTNSQTFQRMSGPEFNAKIDSFRTDANKKLARYNTQMDETGQMVSTKPQPPAQSTPIASPAFPGRPGIPARSAPPVVPPAQMLENRIGTDAQGNKWIVRGGRFVPYQQQGAR